MTPSGEDIPNPNNSLKRFGMSSTDFGNMWDAGDGTVWAVFGDNFNNRGGDWLSNSGPERFGCILAPNASKTIAIGNITSYHIHFAYRK
jgi:hypothetical protein